MKRLLLLIALAVSQFAHAQTQADSVNEKIDQLRVTLNQLSKAILEDKHEFDTAVIVQLKKTRFVRVYNNEQELKDSVEIEKIIFDVRDGLILDIQVVTTEKRVFTNYWAPVALTRFNNTCNWLSSIYLLPDKDTTKKPATRKKNTRKVSTKSYTTEHWYIYTCDFLNILRMGISVPDNAIFELTKSKNQKVLTRATGINQVVDLRVYTDMFAALADEPNGIAQFEGSSRIFINNKNWFRRSTTPFRYGYFSIQASRLDSKFQAVTLDSSFSRLKAIQRSIVNVDVGVNLMSVWLQNKSRSWASLNGGGGVNLFRAKSLTDTTIVSSQFIFLEALFEFKELKNFGIDFSGRLFWQKFNGLEGVVSGTQPFLRVGVAAYWHPLRNPASRIFTRVNYLQNLEENGDAFIQVQLGYSLVISSLLSKDVK